MEVPQENVYKTSYTVEMVGEQEARGALEGLEEQAVRLKEQLAALKEEPLQLAPEGELPKPPRAEAKALKESPEEKPGDKKKEKAAIDKVSGAMSQGLVKGLKSGDVKGAMKDMGAQLATDAATSVLNSVFQSALSFIPGIGPLLSGLFGGLFQSEGLVTSPTLAMVGEREPEFIMTQERMRGLLSGGKPGYGFGPGDFGTPNVNVAAPNVAVEVSVAPGVDADIQTAYRARAGEARLSQLEG
jgi:hypothetical protein